MKMKKFWNWTNIKTEDGEIKERILELNGTIAEESWFDDDVTPKMFKEELNSSTGPVTVWINSPGGDCVAASQIYAMLRDYKDEVTIKIDGIAASAASVIAMSGTKVLMSPTALLMIHNPATGAFGDHVEMKKTIEMLDEVKKSIINAYALKTNLTETVLSHMMDETTWMNAKKAIELKFADGLLTDEKISTLNEEAYSFSTKSVTNSLINKISKKAEEKVTREKIEAEEKIHQNIGRSVDELKADLEKIRKYI